MKYNIIICESDRKKLESNINYVEAASKNLGINISIHTFQSPEEFLNSSSEVKYDIAILADAFSNSKYSGVCFAHYLGKHHPDTVIAFMTEELIPVIEAYRVKAFDYILKPIEMKYFIKIWQRMIRQVNYTKRYNNSTYITLTVDYIKQQIKLSQIIYTEKSNQRLQIILTNNKTIEVNYTTKKLLGLVDSSFAMPNQSNIVNLNHIDRIEGIYLHMKNNAVIKISRNYRQEFMKHYEKFVK